MTVFSLSLLLPILFFVLLFLHGAAAWRDQEKGRDWRYAFLLAVVVWGVIVALSTELLSLVDGVTQLGVAVVWLLALAGLYWWSDGLTGVVASLRRLGRGVTSLDRWQQALLLGFTGLSGLLFAVAWVSPPNNVDSLLYHMSRVAHWAQNASLEHYPTAKDHQLLKPIWAEEAILQLRLLWGDDRPAELVQWFSMLGSVIGVSAIAADLGAGRTGQWAAAAFTFSVPMGVLQATSTQNDYATAFWLVVLAYFIQRSSVAFRWREVGLVAATVGLGLLTKGPFYVYLPPLALWFAINRLRAAGLGRTAAEGAVVMVVAVTLNLGFWARNIQTYGGPFGTSDWLEANVPILGIILSARPLEVDDTVMGTGSEHWTREPAAIGTGPAEGTEPTGGALARRLAGRAPVPSGQDGPARRYARRLASLLMFNYVTPSSAVNQVTIGFVERYPQLFRAEMAEDMRAIAWNHEDTAGNPLHLTLVPISLLLVGLAGRRLEPRPLLLYAAVALAGYGLVAIVIGHGSSIWGLRYQLPFFVLWGPVAGAAVGAWAGRWAYGAAVGLFLFSLPYILLNNTRPVIGMPPWPTRTESVFTSPAEDLMFAIVPEFQDEYTLATDRIQERECRRVGLILTENSLEYLFWWLLDAPQSGVELQVLEPPARLQRYADPGFDPCAVICLTCQGMEQVADLPMDIESGPLNLYVSP